MSGRYDVAIVGGGHNGLVAAAYLARTGKSVVVLERAERVGGTANTIEVAPGFRASGCFASAETFSPVVAKDLALSRHGLRLSPARGSALAAAAGWLLFDGRGRLRDGAPGQGDRAALAELERLLGRIAGALAPIYRQPLPDLESLGAADTLDLLRVGWRLRRLGLRDMREAMRLLPMSMRDVVEERFASGRLSAAVSGLGVRAGVYGPYAAGTLFAALHHLIQNPRPLFAGPELVAGGMGALAEALAAAAKSAGAEVRTDSGVATVEVEAGRVSGVTLADGGHVEAPIVLSDLDPGRTLLGLVAAEHLDPDFRDAAANVRARGAVGVVAFALDGLPEAPAGEESLAGRIQIGDAVIELERAIDACHAGRLADEPLVHLEFPSLADPDLAPEGKHVATAWVAGVPEGVDDLAGEAGRAIDRVIPGFSTRVSASRAATPEDLARAYGATNGCVFDADVTLDQALFLRPIPGWYDYRTPIAGLYLCGSGTHAGGGISGLPGRNAARRAIADAKAGRSR